MILASSGQSFQVDVEIQVTRSKGRSDLLQLIGVPINKAFQSLCDLQMAVLNLQVHPAPNYRAYWELEAIARASAGSS